MTQIGKPLMQTLKIIRVVVWLLHLVVYIGAFRLYYEERDVNTQWCTSIAAQTSKIIDVITGGGWSKHVIPQCPKSTVGRIDSAVDVVMEDFPASFGGSFGFASKPVYDLNNPSIVQIFFDDNVVNEPDKTYETYQTYDGRRFYSFGTCTFITEAGEDAHPTPIKDPDTLVVYRMGTTTRGFTYVVKADLRVFDKSTAESTLDSTMKLILQDVDSNHLKPALVMFHFDANGAVILTDNFDEGPATDQNRKNALALIKLVFQMKANANVYSAFCNNVHSRAGDELSVAACVTAVTNSKRADELDAFMKAYVQDDFYADYYHTEVQAIAMFRHFFDRDIEIKSAIRTNGVEGSDASQVIRGAYTHFKPDLDFNEKHYEIYHYFVESKVPLVGTHLDHIRHGFIDDDKFIANKVDDEALVDDMMKVAQVMQSEPGFPNQQQLRTNLGELLQEAKKKKEFKSYVENTLGHNGQSVPNEHIVHFHDDISANMKKGAQLRKQFSVGKASGVVDAKGDSTLRWVPAQLYQYTKKARVEQEIIVQVNEKFTWLGQGFGAAIGDTASETK
eukprot:TRINITY_DN56560_c0_g1_i1.p1 TRINITY_DN56560_c0_g1~~TRINITY_DN56560_c0_g1_i1.p1  ORF type:complete len:573 (-),score=60.99 TRINITY_DN56560_c0_g1_i1:228-1910(-)